MSLNSHRPSARERRFRAAGNLAARTNNALVQSFGVNSLNQLTNGTRTGTLTVAGTTWGPATSVTVNGAGAALYGDRTFAKDGFTVTNGQNGPSIPYSTGTSCTPSAIT